MPFTPEQHREYKKRLRAKGICVTCRKRKAAKGHPTCDMCIDRDRLNARKLRRKRVENNLCQRCGKPKDTASFKNCINCTIGSGYRAYMGRLMGRHK